MPAERGGHSSQAVFAGLVLAGLAGFLLRDALSGSAGGETQLLSAIVCALGLALGLLPRPATATSWLPWLASVGILALMQPWPGRAEVISALLIASLLTRLFEARSAPGPAVWVLGALASQWLVRSLAWRLPAEDGVSTPLTVATLWVALPVLAGTALWWSERDFPRATLWVVAVSAFCLTGGWSPISLAAVAVPAFVGAVRRSRRLAALVLAVAIGAVSFSAGWEFGAFALLTLALAVSIERGWAGAQATVLVIAVALSFQLMTFALEIWGLASGVQTTRFPGIGQYFAALFVPLFLVLPTLVDRFGPRLHALLVFSNSWVPAVRSTLAHAVIVVVATIAAVTTDTTGSVFAVALLVLTPRASTPTGSTQTGSTPRLARNESTSTGRGVESPVHAPLWQVEWSAAILAYVLWAGSYPWLSERPLARLAGSNLPLFFTACIVLPLLLWGVWVAEVRFAAGGPSRDLRRGAPALIGLAILALATNHVPSHRLLESPRQLIEDAPSLDLRVEGDPIHRTFIVDAYLSNSLALGDGEVVATVVAVERGTLLRSEHSLRHRIQIGEWAAQRSDVVASVGNPSPIPWRSTISGDGSFVASQYRIKVELPAGFDTESIRFELEPDLPGSPALTLLSVRGIPPSVWAIQ